MKKVDKSSAPDLDVISNSETPKSSRRDFFKKAVVYSASAVAASSILAPVKALAEDTQRWWIYYWRATLGYHIGVWVE